MNTGVFHKSLPLLLIHLWELPRRSIKRVYLWPTGGKRLGSFPRPLRKKRIVGPFLDDGHPLPFSFHQTKTSSSIFELMKVRVLFLSSFLIFVFDGQGWSSKHDSLFVIVTWWRLHDSFGDGYLYPSPFNLGFLLTFVLDIRNSLSFFVTILGPKTLLCYVSPFIVIREGGSRGWEDVFIPFVNRWYSYPSLWLSRGKSSRSVGPECIHTPTQFYYLLMGEMGSVELVTRFIINSVLLSYFSMRIYRIRMFLTIFNSYLVLVSPFRRMLF